MNSLSEIVEVVIGVDTHVETHTAAVVDARTGAVLDEATVPTTPQGYQDLVDLADAHSSVAGVGHRGHWRSRRRPGQAPGPRGGGRARAGPPRTHQASPRGEVRPVGRGACHREALSRPRLGTPRAGGDRQALSVLLAARRSAVDASTVAQRQLFSLVIAAPEHLRAKLRGRKLPEMVRVAARLRVQPGWDTESATTAATLRTLARRVQALTVEAADLEKQILAIVRSWRPDLLEGARHRPDRGRDRAVRVVPPRPGPAPKPRSRCSPVRPRSPPTAARSPPATGSTVTATDSSTAP